MTWAAFLMRNLRLSAARWVVLALVIALTSALAMVWPRWLATTTTRELRRDLGAASSTFVDPGAEPRSVVVEIPPTGEDGSAQVSQGWRQVDQALSARRDAVPDPLRGLLGAAQYWLAWQPLPALDPSVADRGLMYLQPASAPQLLEHAHVVEGRVPALERPVGDDVEQLEVLLSAESAREMRWSVGGVRPTGTVDADGVPIVVVLVGTFEADEPESSYWQNAAPLLWPTFSGTNDTGPVVTVRGLVSPGVGLRTVALAVAQDSARLWYPLDIDGVEAANAPLLAEQLRTELRGVSLGGGAAIDFVSDAPDRIDEVLARAHTAQSVLALVVSAPAGVLLALLALAAQVVVAPRRGTRLLVALRGSSLAQHRLLLGAEAASVCLPAAALGGALAQALVPADVSPLWWFAPAALGLTPVVALAVAPTAPVVPRAAIEAGVALLTVAAVVELLVRGADGATGTEALAVVAPLLLAVSTALACVRAMPLVLRPLAERLRARDDLVAPLGAALAAGRASPMTAIVATVAGTAVAILGVLATSTIDTGRTGAAVADVGADLRVTGVLDEGRLEELRGVPGVSRVAAVAITTSVAMQVGDSRIPVKLIVADADLTAVQEGVADGVVVPPVGGIVVSTAVQVRTGDSVELTTSPPVTLAVTTTSMAAPGLTGAQRWMIVDRGSLADVDLRLEVTAAFIALDGNAAPEAVADAVRAVVGPDVTVTTTQERLDQLRTAPTAQALSTGVLVVVALGLIAAMLAVALSLAAGSASRTRMISVLRTMGLPPRAEVRLVLWEAAPIVVVAVVTGAGLGFAFARILLATTDVRPFTGGSVQPGLVVDPAALAGAAGMVLVVAAAAVVISAFAAARRSAAVVLRAGEGPT